MACSAHKWLGRFEHVPWLPISFVTTSIGCHQCSTRFKKKMPRSPLTNAAVSTKLLELSVTSLAGFCSYDGGPCTEKYKVVATSAKRKSWRLAKKRKFGKGELEQMLTWPIACKPGWDSLEAAKRTLSPGLASLAPASQPPRL